MLACLAVSDAYSLFIFMLHHLTNLIDLIMCIYSFFHYDVIIITLYYLGRFNAGMQLSVLVCIRFIAIVYPIKFKTRCTCKAVIGISMAVSVMVLILTIVSQIVRNVIATDSCVILTATRTVNFIVPSSIFMVLHFFKVRALRHSQALNNKSSLKMNVVMCIVMTIYILSSAFEMIIYIMQCFTDYWYQIYRFYEISAISFVLNCASNPFIYVFSSPPFIKMIQKMWHQLRQRCQFRNNGTRQGIEINNIQIHVVSNNDNIEND